ncbi:hypothetical protein CALCODRAFT_163939 [Calocera cornea HHB12733]|uniref:Uncharacterized protein n=1 Tax=Calocera cornea HHB12733 TaxID=1353952 RepID=A0A165CJ09_9BASI|nr:hypothetical protein CALCODRAFT_163939 [Calocera cornea HHB12733]
MYVPFSAHSTTESGMELYIGPIVCWGWGTCCCLANEVIPFEGCFRNPNQPSPTSPRACCQLRTVGPYVPQSSYSRYLQCSC